MEEEDNMLSIELESREIVLNVKKSDKLFFQRITTKSDYGDDYADVIKSKKITISELEMFFNKDLESIYKKVYKEVDKKTQEHIKLNYTPNLKELQKLREENRKLKEKINTFKELIRK